MVLNSFISLIKINFPKISQMPTLLMTKQAQYLHVKQKLDSYHLPTIFPIQMMPLITKIIERLQAQIQRNNTSSLSQIKKQDSSRVCEIQLSKKHIDKALRSQMSRVLDQNNQLHIQIISLKQQVLSNKHCLDKILVGKSDNKDQIKQIINFKNSRENELLEKLQISKFKYNELVEFIHQEDNLQKMYIKRLFTHKVQDLNHNQQNLNHKKQQLTNQQQAPNNKGLPKKQTSNQDSQNRVTFKDRKNGNSKVKQSQEKTSKTVQPNRVNVCNQHECEQRLNFLHQKLANRQKQMVRLQSVITHDGLNLNRVIAQFTDQMQRKKYLEMQQRLALLESENQKITKEVGKSRKTGGRYQALRQEVDKCHQIIKELKSQNSVLRRSKEQADFDLQKERKQLGRSLNDLNSKTLQMKVTKFSDDLAIQDLKRKVQFYQEQTRPIPEPRRVSKKNYKGLKKAKSSTKGVSEPNQQAKKKSSLMRQKDEDLVKLKVKNDSSSRQKALAINGPINQISEQSQEQSIQQQNFHSTSQLKAAIHQDQQLLIGNMHMQQEHKILRNKNKQHQDSQQLHSQQTLIQQYQCQISELTNKCLTLREQLELKNQSIESLQQIINKVIINNGSTNYGCFPQNNNEKRKIDSHNELSNQNKVQLQNLNNKLQSLSQMLNQSQFQKQQLRRQMIQLQQLYERTNLENQTQMASQRQPEVGCQKKLLHTQLLLEQKQRKIQQMKKNNLQIEERSVKSNHRIKRLNDQIEQLIRDRQVVVEGMAETQDKLKQTNQFLHQLHLRHQDTMELSQKQKDEIIRLQKHVLTAQDKIRQLQIEVEQLIEDNQRLKNKKI